MNGLIILASMVFVAYFMFAILRTKKIKYILTPLISLLYGFILFFVGMGMNSILYYVLAVLPAIAVIFNTILQKKAK